MSGAAGVQRFRAVLIGAGKVGMGYAEDPVMARHYPFASHAQVLAAHPSFAWTGVVDPSVDARREASGKWGVPFVSDSAGALPAGCRPDVAILATPPEGRIGALEALPGLRAVLAEKPLGRDAAEAAAFLDYCRGRGLVVQVNLWRRADERFRELADGGLQARIGAPRAAFGAYGNGLANNGTHLIDLARMFLGAIESVQAAGSPLPGPPGPIPGDVNLPFALRFRSGLSALFHPVRFSEYRENSLEVWGEKGKLAILQEGLGIRVHPVRDNRAMRGEREIDSGSGESLVSTVGHAFYRMYDNLADALRTGAPLWAPGRLAEEAASVIEAIRASAEDRGRAVAPRFRIESGGG